MASKAAAMVLCVVGGLFYMLGGFAGGTLIMIYETFLRYGISASALDNQDFFWILELSIVIGVITGSMIIVGGVMMNSNLAERRRLGLRIAVIGTVAGLVNTLGGAVLGALLSLIGCILGTTYKEPRPMGSAAIPSLSPASPPPVAAAFSPPRPSPEMWAAESSGIENLRRFTIIAMFSSFVTAVFLFFPTTVYAYPLLTLAASLIAVLEFVSLAIGFRALARSDKEKFGSIWKLIPFLLVAVPVVDAATLYFMGSIQGFTTTATTSQTDAIALLSDLAPWLGVIMVAGTLALIGEVGAILGLWRIGSKYGQTSVRVGAILFIIPLVSVAGSILLFTGIRQIARTLNEVNAPPPQSTSPGQPTMP